MARAYFRLFSVCPAYSLHCRLPCHPAPPDPGHLAGIAALEKRQRWPAADTNRCHAEADSRCLDTDDSLR